MSLWAAPHATGGVQASVWVPGSKSATARSLVLSSLATGVGTIAGGLQARDTALMTAGLEALSASVDDQGSCWQVTPIRTWPSRASIDCGLAGTVMRFLAAVAALGPGTVRFTGDEAASARPMTALVQALADLGATVDQMSLPLQITGPVTGHEVVLDSSASSQFISALLLAAARMPDGLTVTHRGGPVPSMPHIEMTMAALRARGVEVRQEGMTWTVPPGPIEPLDEVIEPDLTTAAVFLAAGLVTGGQVSVMGWPRTSTQPGIRTTSILEAMGATVEVADDRVTVSGAGHVAGIDIDLHDTSELTPVVAAVATLAETPTVIRGVAHIRGHETDRLHALSTQISSLGGQCREEPDGLVITPVRLQPGVFRTYADHRMAHAGALIGLAVPGIQLDDVECTSKTMPQFAPVWESLVR